MVNCSGFLHELHTFPYRRRMSNFRNLSHSLFFVIFFFYRGEQVFYFFIFSFIRSHLISFCLFSFKFLFCLSTLTVPRKCPPPVPMLIYIYVIDNHRRRIYTDTNVPSEWNLKLSHFHRCCVVWLISLIVEEPNNVRIQPPAEFRIFLFFVFCFFSSYFRGKPKGISFVPLLVFVCGIWFDIQDVQKEEEDKHIWLVLRITVSALYYTLVLVCYEEKKRKIE